MPTIFSLETITLVHVAISLAGIGSGLVEALGMLSGKRLDRWTAVFLATTVATSVTGYGFPFDHQLASHTSAASPCWCSRWRSSRAMCAGSPAVGGGPT